MSTKNSTNRNILCLNKETIENLMTAEAEAAKGGGWVWGLITKVLHPTDVVAPETDTMYVPCADPVLSVHR